MPTREQLTQERLDALIELLVSEGIIEADESGWLRSTRQYREALELAKGLSDRRKNSDDE